MGEPTGAFPKAGRSSPIAFIDLEASGLGSNSWPIEVGWAFESGAPTSMFVRPAPSWPLEAWDENAQRLHGITRERLHREGRDPREVADALNEALTGSAVFSDAPDWDGFWLFRLFSAAGAKQDFALQDFGRLVRPLAGFGEAALLAQATRLSPRNHRASGDARHLQTIYRLARETALGC
jgi:hypothetical protein